MLSEWSRNHMITTWDWLILNIAVDRASLLDRAWITRRPNFRLIQKSSNVVALNDISERVARYSEGRRPADVNVDTWFLLRWLLGEPQKRESNNSNSIFDWSFSQYIIFICCKQTTYSNKPGFILWPAANFCQIIFKICTRWGLWPLFPCNRPWKVHLKSALRDCVALNSFYLSNCNG